MQLEKVRGLLPVEIVEGMAEILDAMGDPERAKPYMHELRAAQK